MPVTLEQVVRRFPGWQIYDLAGGWTAIRVSLVPQSSNLNNVRCGKTMEELVRHLEAEIRATNAGKMA
ncbi:MULTISPECIES: hypothetical protein [unclassified Nonomuraea]|uniref:hypothetical protein n=1 Tax=unclassified Nonomuraea TaxID=2593643 RepID=UPI0033D58865